MTKYQFWVEMLDALTDVPLEEKAHFFAIYTNKPIDKTDVEWYNEYKQEKEKNK